MGKHMFSVPADEQPVSTFVLSSYKHNRYTINGYTVVFMAVCAGTILITIILTACICYKVFVRVCARSVVENTVQPAAVSGELVRATIVKGTPVGQHVDVVVLRGEPVVTGERVVE